MEGEERRGKRMRCMERDLREAKMKEKEFEEKCREKEERSEERMRRMERDLREIKRRLRIGSGRLRKNGGERSERNWIERGEKG